MTTADTVKQEFCRSDGHVLYWAASWIFLKPGVYFLDGDANLHAATELHAKATEYDQHIVAMGGPAVPRTAHRSAYCGDD